MFFRRSRRIFVATLSTAGLFCCGCSQEGVRLRTNALEPRAVLGKTAAPQLQSTTAQSGASPVVSGGLATGGTQTVAAGASPSAGTHGDGWSLGSTLSSLGISEPDFEARLKAGLETIAQRRKEAGQESLFARHVGPPTPNGVGLEFDVVVNGMLFSQKIEGIKTTGVSFLSVCEDVQRSIKAEAEMKYGLGAIGTKVTLSFSSCRFLENDATCAVRARRDKKGTCTAFFEIDRLSFSTCEPALREGDCQQVCRAAGEDVKSRSTGSNAVQVIRCAFQKMPR